MRTSLNTQADVPGLFANSLRVRAPRLHSLSQVLILCCQAADVSLVLRKLSLK